MRPRYGAPVPRIVLFGATGYTGRLVAAALVARGETPLLAARSRRKLDEVAAELAPDATLEVAEADAGRPGSVRGLLDRGDVLVSTVGPFARWGESAVAAARLDARVLCRGQRAPVESCRTCDVKG